MILKNVYKLNTPIINIFESLKEPVFYTLIGNNIHYIIDKGICGANDVYLIIHDKAIDTYHQLILKPNEYQFNGIIDNEVNTFNISDSVTDLSSILNQLTFGSSLGFDSFDTKRVKKITIYGEERTRIWSSGKILKYFGESSDQSISDYLFAPDCIIFQFANDMQLVFKSDRRTWTIKYTKAFEKSMYDGYYSYSELNMKEEEEWYNKGLEAPFEVREELPMYSEEKIIKKLYEFNYT